MHCHALVPDALRPGPLAAGQARGPTALETLIARGRRRWLEVESWTASLMAGYGVAKQRDWPVAPIALLGEGGAPGADCWARADPVHLRVHEDALLAADSGAIRISRAEAESMVESINAHFRGSFTIFPLHPARWYAKLPAAPDMSTTPLEAVRGRPIGLALPAGPEAMSWHRLMNEAQMLLHDHPVNAAREERGELPVNSLWFWGAGSMPQPDAAPFQLVAADDPLIRGLALASCARAQSLPATAESWLDSAPESGVAMVALDALASAALDADGGEWQQRLEELESGWFGPLLAALKTGRLGMLTLHLYGQGCQLQVEATRADLRHIWRRAKPLASYARSQEDQARAGKSPGVTE